MTMRKRPMMVLAGVILLAGCDLDKTNPNAPTQEVTLGSADGLIATAVGLQARFGASTATFAYAAGLVTDELAAVSAALVTISDAENGVVTPGAGFAADYWNAEYRTIKTANDLIVSVENVTMDPGTRSGLLGMAYLIKAAAIGELIQGFKEVALDTYNTATPVFVDRPAALAATLALLDSAQTALTGQAVSSQFTSQVLARGFDLLNTIRAYRARYQRMAGNDQAALTAADAVDRTVFSVLPFSTTVRNPLNVLASGSSGVLPRDAFRLAASAGDGRVTFHVTPAAITGRIGTPLDNYARYNDAAASIPTYYPDEVLLIKAEALVNLNQLAAAKAVVDSVRTDCPGRVPNDPNACLPASTVALTREALLAEIYDNRRFELFATGLRWEDTRRRGTVGAGAAGKRCWLPYTIGERNANPANVPPDPEGTDAPAFPATC
jgi:hypothetical protein